MYGAIASVESRSAGQSHLSFVVNENEYFDGAERAVSRTELLDGSVLVSDWGFAQGRKEVRIGIWVSVEAFELLREFQEDNQHTFIFHYRTSSYVVVIRSCEKGGYQGGSVKANLRLAVVEKLNMDGDYP